MSILNTKKVEAFIAKLVNDVDQKWTDKEGSFIPSLKKDGLWGLDFPKDKTYQKYAEDIDELINLGELEDETSEKYKALMEGEKSILEFINDKFGFMEFYYVESSLSKDYLGYNVDE